MENIEILSNASNAPVIKTPLRKFPGMLIQGDSLSVLWYSAKEIEDLLSEGDVDEAKEATIYLSSILESYLRVYEQTLEAHQIPLPYGRRQGKS